MFRSRTHSVEDRGHGEELDVHGVDDRVTHVVGVLVGPVLASVDVHAIVVVLGGSVQSNLTIQVWVLAVLTNPRTEPWRGSAAPPRP